ncbi:hypothetical protein BLNAU_16641 [Blattamonas nauphoetae]|uniref:Uncharacterized protein n=1 Tax=Blattamonas nauphoetae TaxID=2049346 RepID=A0ABQ9XDU2_9EUKA|nr:hypothetical protein BLNAU_16641 [Blattamonas nauphoetae]
MESSPQTKMNGIARPEKQSKRRTFVSRRKSNLRRYKDLSRIAKLSIFLPLQQFLSYSFFLRTLSQTASFGLFLKFPGQILSSMLKMPSRTFHDLCPLRNSATFCLQKHASPSASLVLPKPKLPLHEIGCEVDRDTATFAAGMRAKALGPGAKVTWNADLREDGSDGFVHDRNSESPSRLPIDPD